ncbi:lysocardiolipin acyltransferase 1-like [Actinia tenebrosa]|uniref:Lysocardiolipin acyltransferase 1-like n=1 Tax=Actinia tenebrosa TaxID=6105 RepID=A0A6P8IJ40_ACTTE|nr:lysocardiolipin acyltransferase 1-like [Actinia tenebrosa]
MLRNPVGGVLFAFMVYFSSFMGLIFILGPSLPLMLVKPKWYRWFNDKAIGFWLHVAPALLELVHGMKVVISGDKPIVTDTALIVMNHRCHFDWMFYWSVLMRYGKLCYLRIVMKDILRHIPGIGWGMQGAMYLFLKRHWEQDEVYLNTVLDYFKDLNYPIQLMIFPEGTNLDEKSQPRSESYARKNNLPIYKHVLHPRVRGFIHCVEKLRKATKRLDAVYDVTIGYDEDYCYKEQDIITGNFPKEIHFHIQRYTTSELPSEYTSLEEWLVKRWAEKEERLKRFYESENKGFCPPGEETNQDTHDKEETTVKRVMTISLIFFVIVTIAAFFLLYRFVYARWYLFAFVVMYTVQNVIGFGMDKVQLLIHQKKISKL